MTEPLDHLARRVATDPFFLAAPLDRYARSEGLDDASLAARLQCPVSTLTHLRLCRNPAPEAPRFWQDIQQIAERFALDGVALAEVVRHGQNLLHLQDQGDTSSGRQVGFLMAARDDDEKPTPSSETPP